MKRLLMLAILTVYLVGSLCSRERRSVVRLETTYGVIRIALSDDTPGHRDNFIKLIRQGFYNGTTFHRVIKDFIIQGGDPLSKQKPASENLGSGSPGYLLAPEIDLPYQYHCRGAVAMAREDDSVNPDHLSNGSQFYIVWGRTYTSNELDKLPVNFSLDMSLDYRTIGGTPELDGAYTVFGEVIEGMEVVKNIQAVSTDSTDKPLTDIFINEASIEQLSKKAEKTLQKHLLRTEKL